MTESTGTPGVEAFAATRARAEAGDAVAHYILGFKYYTGRGVAQDHEEAARWYRLAADQGFADALRPATARRLSRRPAGRFFCTKIARGGSMVDPWLFPKCTVFLASL